MKLTHVSILLFSAATAFPLAMARAADSDDRPRQPPAAAFDACSGKSSGDTCSVTFRDRTITGTCKTIPQEDRLICWPDQPPPGPPPDESGR
jgi:hypothetical protein